MTLQHQETIEFNHNKKDFEEEREEIKLARAAYAHNKSFSFLDMKIQKSLSSVTIEAQQVQPEQKEDEDVNYVSVQESPVKSVAISSKASEKSGKLSENSEIQQEHEKAEPLANNISVYQETIMI